jgi:hypothetical protein
MSLNRSFRVLALIVFAGCASHNAAPPGASGGPCANGNGVSNRQAPIICVDDRARKLAVDPDPITIHNVRKNDMASPVMVHWYTRSGTGDLQLKIEEGCLAEIKCDGRGHCQARTEPKSLKSCKYDVWITGDQHELLDPTIVIVNCCG